MEKKLKNNYFFIALSALSILVVFLPYLKPDLIIGSDYPFHLARIESLKTAILDGSVPAKIHSDLCYTYGYGVGFFYPDFFLYIPALFMVFGFSLELAFKVFAALIFIGIYTSVFYSVYRLTSDRWAATASAVLILFSNQLLGSMYYAFTLGTSLAFIFMPIAIAGMYLFLTTDCKPWMVSIGFSGLLLSHILSTLLTFSVCLLLVLINFKVLLKAYHKVMELLTAVICVSLITAFFWVPMLEQFKAQTFRAAAPWTFVDDNVLSLGSLFHGSGFGIVLTILLLLILLLSVAGYCHIKGLRTFLLLGCVYWLLPTIAPFWSITRNLFKFLQFPQRLLNCALILIVFAFAITFHSKIEKANIKNLIYSCIMIVSVICGFFYVRNALPMTENFDGRVLCKEIAGLGAGEEYLPIETTREVLTTPYTAYANDGSTVNGIKSKGTFTFTAEAGKEYYDVPFVWYKGYSAATSDGTALEINKNSDNGLVRITMDEKITNNSSVIVEYKGTRYQMLSYGVSIMSLIIFISFIFWTNIHSKTNSNSI